MNHNEGENSNLYQINHFLCIPNFTNLLFSNFNCKTNSYNYIFPHYPYSFFSCFISFIQPILALSQLMTYCSETNTGLNFRFLRLLVFEIWSILHSNCLVNRVLDCLRNWFRNANQWYSIASWVRGLNPQVFGSFGCRGQSSTRIGECWGVETS